MNRRELLKTLVPMSLGYGVVKLTEDDGERVVTSSKVIYTDPGPLPLTGSAGPVSIYRNGLRIGWFDQRPGDVIRIDCPHDKWLHNYQYMVTNPPYVVDTSNDFPGWDNEIWRIENDRDGFDGPIPIQITVKKGTPRG